GPGMLTYPALGKDFGGTLLLNLVLPVNLVLQRSTVKRLQDASASEGYQRLLDKSKLLEMRDYLLKNGGKTYPNNIICVLNEDAEPQPVEIDNSIKLPAGFKAAKQRFIAELEEKLFVVGIPDLHDAFEIIDGQHRLFSFA